jgi:trehalose/maltose hydrolase-like predicted phosphorylase
VLKRKIELPPVHLYPAAEWRAVEARYSDEFVRFGGARDFDGRLSFAPRRPHAWNEPAFSLPFGGRQIRARLTHDAECYLVDNRAPLNVLVRGEPHLLSPGTAVAIKLPPP